MCVCASARLHVVCNSRENSCWLRTKWEFNFLYIMLCFICIKILIKNKCKYLHPAYECIQQYYAAMLRYPESNVRTHSMVQIKCKIQFAHFVVRRLDRMMSCDYNVNEPNHISLLFKHNLIFLFIVGAHCLDAIGCESRKTWCFPVDDKQLFLHEMTTTRTTYANFPHIQ